MDGLAVVGSKDGIAVDGLSAVGSKDGSAVVETEVVGSADGEGLVGCLVGDLVGGAMIVTIFSLCVRDSLSAVTFDKVSTF